MLTRTAIGLAVILATASGSLAATRLHAVPVQGAYNSYGSNVVRTDPDPAVRFDLTRDWSHGRY